MSESPGLTGSQMAIAAAVVAAVLAVLKYNATPHRVADADTGQLGDSGPIDAPPFTPTIPSGNDPPPQPVTPIAPGRSWIEDIDWSKIAPATPEAVPATNTPTPPYVDTFSYDDYEREIGNALGAAYADMFRELTFGQYRMSTPTDPSQSPSRYSFRQACYMVYAFQHGWQHGYCTGLVRDADWNVRYQQATQYYQTWPGADANELFILKNLVDSGWRAGRRRGAADLARGNPQQDVPQPTRSECWLYYEPPGRNAPNFDDLRNAD